VALKGGLPKDSLPVVDVRTLLYRGQQALKRAQELRAAAQHASSDSLRALVDEVCDLVALAVESNPAPWPSSRLALGMGRGARGHARAPRLGAARRRRAPARPAPAARRSAALDWRGRAGAPHVPTPHAALAADPPGCQGRRRGVPGAAGAACDGGG